MRKRFLSVFTTSLLVAASFTACKKNDKGPGSENGGTGTYTKEKIAGTYRLSSFTAKVGTNTVDIMDDWESCEKDDLYMLMPDQTYKSEDAGETCADSNQDQGSWSINGNKLTIATQEFTIDSYQGNEMKLSGQVMVQNQSYPVNATYVKQ